MDDVEVPVADSDGSKQGRFDDDLVDFLCVSGSEVVVVVVVSRSSDILPLTEWRRAHIAITVALRDDSRPPPPPATRKTSLEVTAK